MFNTRTSNTEIHCTKCDYTFFTSYQNIANGYKCPACSKNTKYTKEFFIKKARGVHGDLYSYDNFKYISYQEKSIITCSTHGDFLQTPDSHLSGRGCQKCGGTDKYDFDDFVRVARESHGSKFKYLRDEFKAYCEVSDLPNILEIINQEIIRLV